MACAKGKTVTMAKFKKKGAGMEEKADDKSKLARKAKIAATFKKFRSK